MMGFCIYDGWRVWVREKSIMWGLLMDFIGIYAMLEQTNGARHTLTSLTPSSTLHHQYQAYQKEGSECGSKDHQIPSHIFNGRLFPSESTKTL